MACEDSPGQKPMSDWERTARVLQPTIATLFFLSSLRMFNAQLAIRVYDRLGLVAVLLIALAVFSTALIAIFFRRLCTHPLVISALPLAIALTRLAGQFANWPDANWICAGLAIAFYGLYLPLYAGWLASRERRGLYALAWALVAVFPLDLCLRALFSSADLFFHRGPASLIVVIILAGLLASRTITWPRRIVREEVSPLGSGGLADALILMGIGPTLFLGYALYLNASMAGPLANAAYPAAVITCAGVAVLVGTALYYDVDAVQLLDRNPLLTSVLANLGLAGATAVLTFDRLSHWNLPLMAVGLGALLVNMVLLARILASTAGHPTHVMGVGFWLGGLVSLGLIGWMMLYRSDWALIVGAGLAVITALAAGVVLHRRSCPARVVRPASWVWISSIFIILLVMAALFFQPAGATPQPTDQLTLLTYNIRSGFGADDAFDLGRTARAILAADADIVALQEVNRGDGLNGFTDDVIALLAFLRPAGYRYWSFGPAAAPTYGNAIFSRFPIVADQNFLYAGAIHEQRGCLTARVKVGARRVAIYATHLTHVGDSTLERLDQVRQLLEIAAADNLPKAIMGDMNARPETEEIRQFTATYDDAYIKAGGRPPGYTFRADAPDRRIDYIFIAGGLIPVAARVAEGELASDHLPLIVQVRFSQ